MSSELQDVEIFELAYGTKPMRVDREKCIVYGCKVLGERSANPPPHNNQYPRATRVRAISFLEGARCFVGHNRKADADGRSYADSFGTHKNLEETGDGLHSDFHYNPKHPLAEQFIWDAEHAPENVGFSIASAGKRKVVNGVAVVEEINFDRRLHSIDLVCRGATTNTLFESQTMTTTPKTATIKAILTEALAKAPADKFCAAAKTKIFEDLPGGSTDASMPLPADDASSEDQVAAAFKSMVIAVLDDGSLDTSGKIAKIKQILQAQDKLTGKADKSSSDAGGGDSKTTEGLTVKTDPTLAQLQEELAAVKHENLAARICGDAGIVPSNLLRRALKTAKDEGEMKQLVEEFKAVNPAGGKGNTTPAPGNKPRSASVPLRESQTGAGAAGGDKLPTFKNNAERVAFMRNNRMPAASAN